MTVDQARNIDSIFVRIGNAETLGTIIPFDNDRARVRIDLPFGGEHVSLDALYTWDAIARAKNEKRPLQWLIKENSFCATPTYRLHQIGSQARALQPLTVIPDQPDAPDKSNGDDSPGERFAFHIEIKRQHLEYLFGKRAAHISDEWMQELVERLARNYRELMFDNDLTIIAREVMNYPFDETTSELEDVLPEDLAYACRIVQKVQEAWPDDFYTPLSSEWGLYVWIEAGEERAGIVPLRLFSNGYPYFNQLVPWDWKKEAHENANRSGLGRNTR